MGIDEPENHDGFTKIGKEDWAEIEKLAEAWVAGLPFEAIYQVAKRFHVHLLTMMFCEDKDYFEEIKRDHKANQESDAGEDDDVTIMLVKKLDRMVGFIDKTDEEMELEVQADEVVLPDKEFFKKLGLD